MLLQRAVVARTYGAVLIAHTLFSVFYVIFLLMFLMAMEGIYFYSHLSLHRVTKAYNAKIIVPGSPQVRGDKTNINPR